MIEIRNLKLPLSAGTPSGDHELRRIAAEKLGISQEHLDTVRLLKRSVDARRKADVHFVATLGITLKLTSLQDEASLVERIADSDVLIAAPVEAPTIKPVHVAPQIRPVVVGTGPAGLFAALKLALSGARPLVLERGSKVDERVAKVAAFTRDGALDPESNIQFGEGGAGTFSDGKLNTNIHNPRCVTVLEEFVRAGAPEEILWQAKPHIGTDHLTGSVKNIRRKIESLGGEVRFGTRLADITLNATNQLIGITVESEAGRQEIAADTLILATGHSARDTFKMLQQVGATLTQKAFSIGVRIEHDQHMINRAQYGSAAHHPALGAADYKLSCHLPSGRSVYSFCMCPGGYVVAAASETGGVVTNGMSRFARAGANSNSAFLVNVVPEDFGSEHPLAGIEFQRRWERAAYKLAGSNYKAPAQLLGDFVRAKPSRSCGAVQPTYPLGVTYSDLSDCLPEFVTASLREAVPLFNRRLRGFATPDAVLTGVETRSSSPVRIVRDETLQSNVRGVYPCGEGAGYAGGIMSAAVDGLRCADAVLERYRQQEQGQSE